MDKEAIVSLLNEEQKEAVLATEGPVLILAGAGSGKTRVLVHRIAYLIDVIGVNPGNILAITFTNKAADEMRERVDQIVGFGSQEVWVSTFHSLCVRILRRNADLLGYTQYFSIYDTDDQVSLMKTILKARNLDTKKIKEKAVLGAISSAKNELVTPKKYRLVNKDWWGDQVGELYEEYQERLRANNAMDFDDLIMQTVALFEQHKDVLAFYQDLYPYLMVDEYQDTNTAQFRFISLLAEKYTNLCVVGDDDQSIYKFRGANIRNILNFEKFYPDARVIKLERNYRSTKHILDAANEVIRNNRGRKEKKLWTSNEEGTKVRLRRFGTGFEEADSVIREIGGMIRTGKRKYSDIAILYRTNAQSRLFEEKCLLQNIPYRIVGGVNFYARREIKDILAYLKTIDNAVDDLAVHRIINIPKRGIGATTIGKIDQYAQAGGISFYEAACDGESIPGITKATAKKISLFTDFIGRLKAYADDLSVSELLKKVISETGYTDELKAVDDEDARARIENIDELVSKAVQYEETDTSPTLSGFLEEVALIADIDSVEAGDDRVLLMTLHSAKGLEFPVVFMAGMEEGLFPSTMSINAENPAEEIEEERRLAYVGITRARQELIMTCARERMVRGDIVSSPLSRFVREIPRDMIDTGEADKPPKNTYSMKGNTALSQTLRDAFSVHSPAPKPNIYANPYLSGSHSRPAEKPVTAPYAGKAEAEAEKSGTSGSGLGYTVGDHVRHVKFGEGTVMDIRNGGRDYEVTVDFPAWGRKKMFAAFAKLKKL